MYYYSSRREQSSWNKKVRCFAPYNLEASILSGSGDLFFFPQNFPSSIVWKHASLGSKMIFERNLITKSFQNFQMHFAQSGKIKTMTTLSGTSRNCSKSWAFDHSKIMGQVSKPVMVLKVAGLSPFRDGRKKREDVKSRKNKADTKLQSLEIQGSQILNLWNGVVILLDSRDICQNCNHWWMNLKFDLWWEPWALFCNVQLFSQVHFWCFLVGHFGVGWLRFPKRQ